MSQRISGHDRIPADLYETPSWLIKDALAQHFSLDSAKVWECAAGKAKMANALVEEGCAVYCTDVFRHSPRSPVKIHDFIGDQPPPLPDGWDSVAAIITNPPYGFLGKTAHAFARRGISYIDRGFTRTLALLLPVDFDSAKGRADIFRDCDLFAAKIVLTKRIVWFEPPPREDGKKNHGPSANHAWFIWGGPDRGKRTIYYAP